MKKTTETYSKPIETVFFRKEETPFFWNWNIYKAEEAQWLGG